MPEIKITNSHINCECVKGIYTASARSTATGTSICSASGSSNISESDAINTAINISNY